MRGRTIQKYNFKSVEYCGTDPRALRCTTSASEGVNARWGLRGVESCWKTQTFNLGLQGNFGEKHIAFGLFDKTNTKLACFQPKSQVYYHNLPPNASRFSQHVKTLPCCWRRKKGLGFDGTLECVCAY